MVIADWHKGVSGKLQWTSEHWPRLLENAVLPHSYVLISLFVIHVNKSPWGGRLRTCHVVQCYCFFCFLHFGNIVYKSKIGFVYNLALLKCLKGFDVFRGRCDGCSESRTLCRNMTPPYSWLRRKVKHNISIHQKNLLVNRNFETWFAGQGSHPTNKHKDNINRDNNTHKQVELVKGMEVHAKY